MFNCLGIPGSSRIFLALLFRDQSVWMGPASCAKPPDCPACVCVWGPCAALCWGGPLAGRHEQERSHTTGVVKKHGRRCPEASRSTVPLGQVRRRYRFREHGGQRPAFARRLPGPTALSLPGLANSMASHKASPSPTSFSTPAVFFGSVSHPSQQAEMFQHTSSDRERSWINVF